MKLYKLSEENYDLAYRVCVARINPNSKKMEYKSSHNYRYDSWKPLVVGETMYGDFHVGSKPEYCLSYFAGNTDLKDGEFEVLLTLKIDTGILLPKE